MANIIDVWLKRSKEVIAQGSNSYDLVPFAPSLLAALYGPQSAQLAAFNSRMKELTSVKESLDFYQRNLAYSTIVTVIGEIENGLIVNFRAQVAGEVMSELVCVGKELLADDTDASKNVSAVLIAAAFEDLMRRMGSELAGAVDDLS
jgi:CheY-specific phosphatase CheX